MIVKLFLLYDRKCKREVVYLSLHKGTSSGVGTKCRTTKYKILKNVGNYKAVQTSKCQIIKILMSQIVFKNHTFFIIYRDKI